MVKLRRRRRLQEVFLHLDTADQQLHNNLGLVNVLDNLCKSLGTGSRCLELDEKVATLHFPALGEVLTVFAQKHTDLYRCQG